MADKVKYSNTANNLLHQCRRKFFFSQIMATHGRKNAMRRKAYELKSMQNLTMWKGSVVDKFIETVIIPRIRDKQALDFPKLADECVELAKNQFRYSKLEVYTDAAVSKNEAGADFCILDIHAMGKEHTETEIAEVYSTVHAAILGIPEIKMPNGQLLIDFLKQANALTPNINNWAVYIEDAMVKPQIDLLAYHNWKPVIMDWKVSDSYTSDYSTQLMICGITVYLKRLQSKDKAPYTHSDIKLFEVNILKGLVTEHEFSVERVNQTIDDINLNSKEILKLTGNREFDEQKIDDFDLTDNEGSCKLCNYRTLCSFLLLNNKYDEKSYIEFIQSKQYN
jgi:hypothetical protein